MVNDAIPSWMSAVERCLEQGNADPVLVGYLDEILTWRLNGGQWDGVSRRAFEVFLDQLLIANPNNYSELFPEALTKEQAKVRYRQLIGLFHPDRGENDPAWLTYRAERLNTAYSQYCNKHVAGKVYDARPGSSDRATSIRGVRPIPSGAKKRKGKHRRGFSSISPDLRKWLGSPEEFEKHVFIGLIALVALFVGLILLSLLVS